MKKITYGPGGFDPSKPNDNVVDETEIDTPAVPLQTPAVVATLLAALGIVDVSDAANACGLTPSDLENEALAWSLFRDN